MTESRKQEAPKGCRWSAQGLLPLPCHLPWPLGSSDEPQAPFLTFCAHTLKVGAVSNTLGLG